MDKFDLKYLFKGDGAKDWYKALGAGWRLVVIFILIVIIALGVKTIINFIFPKPRNVNQPRVIVTPFSKVGKIDQTSTQINVEPEKTWEIGLGGGAITYDNKNGMVGFGWVRRKF